VLQLAHVLGTLVTVDTPRVRRLLSSAINNIRP
jgi:hypothetical protein